MVDVLAQRLYGVEIALRESIEAGRRRAEGIEQSHLDQVEALGVRGDKAARLVDVNAHAVPTVRSAGILRKALLDQIDDLRIELDGVDLARAVIDRLQHIGAGPRAQDQHTWPL